MPEDIKVPEPLQIMYARTQSDGLPILYKEGWNDCIKAMQGELIDFPSAEYCKSYLSQVSNDVRVDLGDVIFKCERCSSEHFSKYMSASGEAAFVCNSCEAVYIVRDKGE